MPRLPPLRVRYSLENGCLGAYPKVDPSIIPPESLVMLRNGRVRDGIVVCRGGLDKRNPDEAMDGAVYGVIDTDGEFDDYTGGGGPTGLGTITGTAIDSRFGTPAVGATMEITAQSLSTTAGAGGAYTLTGVTPGVDIRVNGTWDSGTGLITGYTLCDVVADETTADVTVYLSIA